MSGKHKDWEPFVIGARRPVSLFVGFTADDSAWFCRQIQRATDGVWGHVMVGFWFADHTACYFEALLGDGVTGPWPLDRLTTWMQEPKHRAALVSIPQSFYVTSQVYTALSRADRAVGRQSYSPTQLLAMGLSERYGLPMWRTERRTVCSEYVAWVLGGIVDLRDRRRRHIDQVNPNSAWRRLMDELTPYGRFSRPLEKASRIAQDAPKRRAAPEPGQGDSASMQCGSGGMQRGCENKAGDTQ